MQRGFVKCDSHDSCIRYVPVKGAKEDFVAEMYAWRMHGKDSDDRSAKSSHLQHKPSIEVVQAVKEHLVMEDF